MGRLGGRRAVGRGRVATAVVALAVLTLAGTAAGVAPASATSSVTSSVTSSPTPSPGVPATADGEREPGADQVQAALAQALSLHTAVEGQIRTVAEARAAVAASSQDASLALEVQARADALRDDAAAEATRLELAVATTDDAVSAGRDGLARWARQVYVDGGSLGTSSPFAWTLLAGGSTDDALTNRVWLERVGDDRAQALARLRAAQVVQAAAAERARHASDLAEAAAAQSAASSRARDAVLARHRARLADLESLLAGSRAAADQADARASRLALAWGGGGSPVAGLAADVVGSGGRAPDGAACPGRDVTGYANGRLPLDTLCPVRAAAGLLRADAAASFDGLSRSFEERFGRPLCVTDAYRSFDEQVRVRAERGMWAAVPGRSTHGWGIAVDLCGGVEDFDAPAHAWLVLNAPLHGWYHPAWARRGGPLPEPWHWEFAGEG